MPIAGRTLASIIREGVEENTINGHIITTLKVKKTQVRVRSSSLRNKVKMCARIYHKIAAKEG